MEQEPAFTTNDATEAGETIMAIDIRDGCTMGCAFFDTCHDALMLSGDIPIADVDTLKHFITHIEPTTILASARALENILEFLEKHSGQHNQGS